MVTLKRSIYKAIVTEIVRWNDTLTKLYTFELAAV
jgi:hypothetical protein